MNDIPSRYTATGAETTISITRMAVEQRIGMCVTLPPGHLDADRLTQALRLSFDAEPVIGCAFCTDERRARWQRLSDLDTPAVLVSLDTTDPSAAMRSFQATEVPDAGPQAAVALFRTPDRDVLGIKVSHIAADGQAAKQYAYLLARIYSELGTDPSFAPEPNLTPRPSGKDVWANLSREQRRQARKAKSWSSPTWPAPLNTDASGDLTYQWITVPPERFLALKSFGTERGCTVNDMMLTAVLRACVAHLDPPAGVPLSLMYTADLRRYLPEAASLPISNLSISGSLDIQRVDGEGFEDTLSRVHQRMEEWAAMCHGASPLANAELVAGLGYRLTERLLGLAFKGGGGSSSKTYPWFTNIGVIDAARLSFDGVSPDSGFMFGPATAGMNIVPVVSTYQDALTVCMGYGDSEANRLAIEGLLRSIVGEIESACSAKTKVA